jgi:hypothetical protein
LLSASEMTQTFQEVIQRWHQLQPSLDWEATELLFPQETTTLAGKIQRLGLINCFQWHLEDECRVSYSSQAVLADLKSRIDLSNHRRVKAIDGIDAAIQQRLPQDGHYGQAARIALVTPGSLIDRLSILELKRYHAYIIDPAKLASARVSVELLEEQISDLCAGIDEFFDDLLDGRQRLKVYRTVKLYGME